MTTERKIFKAFLYLILTLIFALTQLSCEKEVSISGPKPPIPQGIIYASSEPDSALIFINDENTGLYTPASISNLPAGEYQITLRMELFPDAKFSFTLGENSTHTVFHKYITVDNNGNISCNSSVDHLIYINDENTGFRCPHLFAGLTPGQYKIKYENTGFRSDSLYITLRARETKNVEMELQDTSICVDYGYYNSPMTSDNTVCIEVDQNNIKWIGTRSAGLLQFNDKEWISYRESNSTLPSNYITWISIDQIDNKWICTSKGLVKIDPMGNWTVFDKSNTAIPNDYITSIDFDSKGIGWVGASSPNKDMYLLKYDGLNFTSYQCDQMIIAIAVDYNDNVWVGTNYGLRLFKDENWIDIEPLFDIENKNENESLKIKPIETLAVDLDGTLWIGVSAERTQTLGGLFVYSSNSFDKFLLSTHFISHINITDEGDKWISYFGKYAGYGGISQINLYLTKIDNSNNMIDYTLLPYNFPTKYFMWSSVDNYGNVWLATRDKGIVKFKGGNL